MKENRGKTRPAYPIPENTAPEGVKCVQLIIPDAPGYMELAFGALLTLGRWNNYYLDGTTRGSQVATTWRNVLRDYPLFEACVTTIYRMDTCGNVEYSNDAGEHWHTLADFSNCFIWRLPNDLAHNLIEAQGNFPGLGIKRHSGQTEPLIVWYDDAVTPVLQAQMTKDFEMQFRGVSNYGWNAIIGRGMVGWNMRQQPNGAIARPDSGLTGFGFFAQSISDNFFRLYGQRPSGNLLEFIRVFAQTDILNSYMELNGQVRVNGATYGNAGLNVKANYPTRPASAFILLSGQSEILHGNVDHVGNLISGFDKYAFHFMRQTSGEPTQTDAKNGALAVDITNHTLWMKDGAGWHELGAEGEPGEPGEDGTGIETVYVDFVPCTDEGGATLEGSALYLTIPNGCDGEPGEPGEPGTNGTDGKTFKYYSCEERPAITTQYSMIIRGDEQVILPFNLHPGDIVNVSAFSGWWSDRVWATGAPPSETGYGANGVVCRTDDETVSIPGDPIDAPHMALILGYEKAGDTQGYINLCDGEVHILDEINPDNGTAWLFPNCETLDGNYGGVHITFEFAPSFEYICDGEYDLTTGRHGVRLATSGECSAAFGGSSGGEYVAGVGFRAKNYNPPEGDYIPRLIIVINCPDGFSEELAFRFNCLSNGASLHFYGQTMDNSWYEYWPTVSTQLDGLTAWRGLGIEGAPFKKVMMAKFAYGNELTVNGVEIEIPE